MFAAGGTVGDSLGRILVDEGVISEHEYGEAIRVMTATLVDDEQTRLGEVLVGLGYLTHEGVQRALERQMRRKIMRCLMWDTMGADVRACRQPHPWTRAVSDAARAAAHRCGGAALQRRAHERAARAVWRLLHRAESESEAGREALRFSRSARGRGAGDRRRDAHARSVDGPDVRDGRELAGGDDAVLGGSVDAVEGAGHRADHRAAAARRRSQSRAASQSDAAQPRRDAAAAESFASVGGGRSWFVGRGCAVGHAAPAPAATASR